MAQLNAVKGAMLQMRYESDTFWTWGAPGCAVLPDGGFFVIAHTEFANSSVYGFQTWRLDSDLNVLDYQLHDNLTAWSPLYVVPLEDYVVQVHMSNGPPGAYSDPRVMLFDCSHGGATIMANNPDPSGPDMGGGSYSYLYTSHLYLREFGIIALATEAGVHLYRRGQLLGSATYTALGFDWRILSMLGMHPHPSDPTKFALMDWDRYNVVTTYEVTVDPATAGLSATKLWSRGWATNPTDWVIAMGTPYADQVWGWVTDQVQEPTGTGSNWNYDRWYLRSMDGGVGTSVWDRTYDVANDNQVVRAITPNLSVAALEIYDNSTHTYSADGSNPSEEEWIGVCVIDTGHGAPSAKMVGLSRKDLVLGPGVPFHGYDDIDDVRNGSQYAPAYRDGVLLMASCPVYRRNGGNDGFPVLVWKLEGAGHAEFSVADDSGKWLPLNDGINPGRLKVHDGSQWWESVSVDTFDQEWKPLKINVAEDGQPPIWRTVALLTPSLG